MELVELVAARDVGRAFLDATADPRLVERVLGEKPREVRVAVRDGAEVRRVFIPWSHGTRRYTLTTSGTVRWDACAGPFREALAVALNEFEGTVMLVSHDRALLRSVCDEFWLVSKGGVAPFDGDLEDYQRYLLDEAKRVREEASAAQKKAAA